MEGGSSAWPVSSLQPGLPSLSPFSLLPSSPDSSPVPHLPHLTHAPKSLHSTSFPQICHVLSRVLILGTFTLHSANPYKGLPQISLVASLCLHASHPKLLVSCPSSHEYTQVMCINLSVSGFLTRLKLRKGGTRPGCSVHLSCSLNECRRPLVSLCTPAAAEKRKDLLFPVHTSGSSVPGHWHRLPSFKSSFCPLWAVPHWTGHLTSPCLNFFICEMELIIVPTSQPPCPTSS